MLTRFRRRLARSILVWDLVLTLLILHLSISMRVWLDYGNAIDLPQADLPWLIYLGVAGIWTGAFLLLAPQRALFSATLIEAIGRLVAAVVLATMMFAGVLYLSYRDVSRLQFLYFAGTNLVTLLFFHLAARFRVDQRGRLGKQHRVLVVGGGAQAQHLIKALQNYLWGDIDLIGITSDEPLLDSALPYLGPITATEQIVKDHLIDEVIFTTPDQQQIVNLSLQLLKYPVMLHMAPNVIDLTFARTPIEVVGGVPLISLRDSVLSEPQRMLKRLFDIIGSLLLLVIFSPLMLVIAIAVKLDSLGPIFFLQERIGEHGQRFKMIKFRSMYHGADRHWQKVTRLDAQGRIIFKSEDDPRITRIGRKLRCASLDELPQLFNVLRGEMSLVGPRPEVPYITAEYGPWQWQRFCVPPGITGWWQVTGRSNKPMQFHTQDDMYYIQNYSFWLDLKILLMTINVVLKRRGAF
jgi:exopolysaccharide biosynthesis polyprenyl glycosylphosphotransferase